ncbi:hypothetical protein TW95_gp0686 [Pandoravirus inopinatum]|uniref:Uncharacterized protein n=1 Tax=Pandoravirus inopinatum TaxID=1605721 RepID=A0A0B5J6M6_9VIRU|nr:hypothetical protein TW95_gp0686 [Pandoravirus inopinatum]AJF97420.1 hypothetical protein [Pandoravirus inopinatum]
MSTAQTTANTRTRRPSRYIVQFSVTGLLEYDQSYIVTREQLAVVEGCNITLDRLCTCDGCELCMAGSVDIKFVRSLPLARVTPQLLLLESQAINLDTIIEAVREEQKRQRLSTKLTSVAQEEQ